MKKTLNDIDLSNKTVIARLDYNVPFDNKGVISDNTRIIKTIPTILEIIKKAKKLIIISHLGRVKKEEDKQKLSLKPVAQELQKILKKYQIKVEFEPATDYKLVKKRVQNLAEKKILVLENTRFYDINNNEKVNLESKCNDELARFYASLADVFVNDAFGTGHRKHASNFGISMFINESAIGRLVEAEIKALEPIMNNPKRPFIAIFGGAKVSDKLGILKTFLEKADKVIIAGGMAYTFMVAQNRSIGNSLLEKDRINLAKEMLSKYGDKIVLPLDNMGTDSFANNPPLYFDKEIPDGMMGLDIGKKSINLFNNIIKTAKTVLWNGPMGVFEFSNYAVGTLEIAKTIGRLKAYSVIGGGDSVAAINSLDLKRFKFSHISTGGGALMTLLEGKDLVGLSKIQEVNEK